jgi:hypothetical protein
LVILSFGLGFHAGIQLRLKLNIDLLIILFYLPHPPLSPFPFRGRGEF